MSTLTAIQPTASARLIRPGDAAYDELRRPWNLAVDQRPAAVALPTHATEVAAVVTAASAAGLRVAVQGGAHHPAPLGDLAGTVLIRTTAMAGVAVDPVRRMARVEAGALWGAVVEAAAQHGLYPLHGSSPDVGVVGYSLGGGLGWAARRHGLQVNRIRAAELVTADGTFVRVDAEHEPELFWALRGGSGLGIVTALEFELLPVTHAYAGWLAWDWRDGERVLARWAEWAAAAPDSATTAARMLKLPPAPELPEAIRGRELFVIDGAVLADAGEAPALLAPLRDLSPAVDTFATVPATALSRIHGDPETPTPVVSDHAMLDRLDTGAVAAFVDAAGAESRSSLLVAELRHLGAAVGRPSVDGGAVTSLDGAFLLYAAGLAADPETTTAAAIDAGRLTAAMSPWAGGRRYGNFTESRADAREFHASATYERLRTVREAVDPDGRFHAAHAVPVSQRD